MHGGSWVDRVEQRPVQEVRVEVGIAVVVDGSGDEVAVDQPHQRAHAGEHALPGCGQGSQALSSVTRTGEEVQALIRQLDLMRLVYDRWKTFLESEWKAKSPDYAPLLALAAILIFGVVAAIQRRRATISLARSPA